MLWILFFTFLFLWVLGWGFGVAGNLIHSLLLAALVILLINFGMGRKQV